MGIYKASVTVCVNTVARTYTNEGNPNGLADIVKLTNIFYDSIYQLSEK